MQVDAGHYRQIANIPTVQGARTSLFDAGAGRLYLAVPRHAERPAQSAPELWVYAASRRRE